MNYPGEVIVGNTTFKIPFAHDVPFDEMQFAALEGDIRAANEVKVPVVLWKERSTAVAATVVDGAHRILIASKLALVRVPTVSHSYASEGEARRDCLRLNEHRRHLTAEQLALLRTKRITRVAAMRVDGLSLRAIAKQEGISEKQVRMDLEDAKKDRILAEPVGGKVLGLDGRSHPAIRLKPRLYGDPISFRGLLHAPINEYGVVFLFGMIARELGFTVESVQAPYPDCEAKRETKSGRWQRVRIEFEFRSRNFKDHGHDQSGCDLIVCWEHDWPDCPIEVVELRSEIKKLEK